MLVNANCAFAVFNSRRNHSYTSISEDEPNYSNGATVAGSSSSGDRGAASDNPLYESSANMADYGGGGSVNTVMTSLGN